MKKNNFPGQIPTCSFLQHLFLLAETQKYVRQFGSSSEWVEKDRKHI